MGAFVRLGRQELSELALGQHHAAHEPVMIEAEQILDLTVHLFDLVGDDLASGRHHAASGWLDLPIGLISSAGQGPLGDEDPLLDLESHLGGAIDRSARHHVLRARRIAVAGGLTEQSQSDSIENGRLAGARRTRDGEETCGGQRLFTELDDVVALQGVQVTDRDFENFHDG